MLVLTRKKSESVRIGDEIEVVVLEVNGKRVRLGFRCPPEISIHRTEVILEMAAEEHPFRANHESQLACV